ncbi:MAG: thioesterase family protein [Thalassobaculaceae bacterium]|nr:thioesterase family protein [Thalassobaculaceae bacterium]
MTEILDTDIAAVRRRLTISDAAREAFALPDDWRAGMARVVEWSDVDAFAHANHTAFLHWFEAARNLYFVTVGIPRHAVDKPGPVMMSLNTRYLKPLAYHDPVFVTARVKSMRRTSFVMEYAAWAKDGCACTCEALLVLMINATGAKVAIPDDVRAAIRALDAADEQ